MTIDQAIEKLQDIKAMHGNTPVYFDCPWCGKSFTPNAVVAMAVHLTQKPKTEA